MITAAPTRDGRPTRIFAGQRSSQRLSGRPGGKTPEKERENTQKKTAVPKGVKRSSQRQGFREPVEFGLSALSIERQCLVDSLTGAFTS